VVIGQRIGALGYAGGITILRDICVLGRRSIERTAFIRFESAAGEQMQIDWGHFGAAYGGTAQALRTGRDRVLQPHALRPVHPQPKPGKPASGSACAQLLRGCPKELVFDNMPTAVTERAGRLIRFNDRFLEFLTQLRIFPKACSVGAPQERAKWSGRSAISETSSLRALST
jgi:transposase